MAGSSTLIWLRQDLRIADNPALHAAAQRGAPAVLAYIHAPHEEGNWQPGGASKWWLHHSLLSLDRQLQKIGTRLVIRRGDSAGQLKTLAREVCADTVLWNRRYEPAAIAQEEQVRHALEAEKIRVQIFNGSLLFDPSAILTRSGTPYQVFTPFYRACLTEVEPAPPLPAPTAIAAPERWPNSLSLVQLKLEPEIDWASGIRATWKPGCADAMRQVEEFLKGALVSYSQDRDRPDVRGTSRLSPYLHYGEISPRQVWHAVKEYLAAESRAAGARGAQEFLRQLIWREFAHYLLYHFPHTTDRPLRQEFEEFPWEENPQALKLWQKGHTGYPIIDAGMRELWTTGWMHNRVRMVAASFLVKDLLQPWVEGAKWFWDTLVDADLANNTLGWQWVAGCGADAAPYFRIFNPKIQGKKFDPLGKYVHKWVPELSGLPTQWIHSPWEAPRSVLIASNVELGKTYPLPIVPHREARVKALAALDRMRAGRHS